MIDPEADEDDRVRELFLGALGLPTGERAGFLDASDEPPGVREAARALLDDHDRARGTGFLSASPALALPLPPPGPATAPDAADVPRRLGPYRVVGELGSGGMGVVYRAYDDDLQRFVAVKALPGPARGDATAAARWERERRAHGRLDHPNLVRAYCTLEDGPARYLVMEHVDGIGLHDLVARDGPLPVAEACEAARQAALGLGHAHGVGVVHRDVKPSNLMLDRRGVVKVLDLGIALLGPASTPAPRLTADHHAPGSLDYMAPEQLLAPREVDGRADVFGLGATLVYLLTGRPPRGEQPSVLHALRAIEAGEVALPAGLPPGLAGLLEAATSGDPAARPATPDDLARALGPFAEGGADGLRRLAATLAPPPTPPPPPSSGPMPASSRSSSGTQRLLTHLLLGAVVAGGLGGFLVVARLRGGEMGATTANEIKPWIEILYLLLEIAFMLGAIGLAIARRRVLHGLVLVLFLTGLGGVVGVLALRHDPTLARRLSASLGWARPVASRGDGEAAPLEATALREAVGLMETRLGREPAPRDRRRKRFLLAGPATSAGRLAIESLGVDPEVVDDAAGLYLIDLAALGLSAADWDRLLAGYPYGVRNGDWDAGLVARVGGDTLPHVRADWLAAEGVRPASPPSIDAGTAAVAAARAAYNRDLGWAEVASELWLDPARHLGALRSRLAASDLADRREVAGLLARGTITRRDWARVYQEVFQVLGLGTPVVKLVAE